MGGVAHLPLPGLEPVGGEPLISVTRGQCDARPTVTFSATLAGNKVYCLVTEEIGRASCRERV